MIKDIKIKFQKIWGGMSPRDPLVKMCNSKKKYERIIGIIIILSTIFLFFTWLVFITGGLLYFIIYM